MIINNKEYYLEIIADNNLVIYQGGADYFRIGCFPLSLDLSTLKEITEEEAIILRDEYLKTLEEQ